MTGRFVEELEGGTVAWTSAALTGAFTLIKSLVVRAAKIWWTPTLAELWVQLQVAGTTACLLRALAKAESGVENLELVARWRGETFTAHGGVVELEASRALTPQTGVVEHHSFRTKFPFSPAS